MKRETVTRRDWDIMVDGLDGDLQETLTEILEDWATGETCEYVEFYLDSLGRLDCASDPRPGEAKNELDRLGEEE